MEVSTLSLCTIAIFTSLHAVLLFDRIQFLVRVCDDLKDALFASLYCVLCHPFVTSDLLNRVTGLQSVCAFSQIHYCILCLDKVLWKMF